MKKNLGVYVDNGLLADKNSAHNLTMLSLFSEGKFLIFEQMLDTWNMCVKSGCWSQYEGSGLVSQEAWDEIGGAHKSPSVPQCWWLRNTHTTAAFRKGQGDFTCGILRSNSEGFKLNQGWQIKWLEFIRVIEEESSNCMVKSPNSCTNGTPRTLHLTDLNLTVTQPEQESVTVPVLDKLGTSVLQSQ